jgi:hypothetical protein
MAKILFFKTKYNAKLVKTSISDGCVIIDNKQYYVDTSKPIQLEKKFGNIEPLYLVKWDNILPSANVHTDDEGIQHTTSGPLKTETVVPKFQDHKGDMPSPAMFRKIMGMQILGNMIKTKKGFKFGNFGMIIVLVGAVAGIVVSLQLLGIIKIF